MASLAILATEFLKNIGGKSQEEWKDLEKKSAVFSYVAQGKLVGMVHVLYAASRCWSAADGV